MSARLYALPGTQRNADMAGDCPGSSSVGVPPSPGTCEDDEGDSRPLSHCRLVEQRPRPYDWARDGE